MCYDLISTSYQAYTNLTPVNVYIDFSKAFACLDHNLLLSKLKCYGLNDNVIRLLKNSYPIEINMCNLEHKVSTSWNLMWNSSRFGNGSTSA